MAIPKRSYWLREVVTEAGTSYHISFRDGQGKIQKLCVFYDFYMAFRRLELDERKIEGWDYRHRTITGIPFIFGSISSPFNPGSIKSNSMRSGVD